MVRIDRQEEGEARAEKVRHLARRYGRIRQEIARLKVMDKALADTPHGQISLTDPDARPMATSARHRGMVGYNVQSAVDTETHIIVTHEVTNQLVHQRGHIETLFDAMHHAGCPQATFSAAFAARSVAAIINQKPTEKRIIIAESAGHPLPRTKVSDDQGSGQRTDAFYLGGQAVRRTNFRRVNHQT